MVKGGKAALAMVGLGLTALVAILIGRAGRAVPLTISSPPVHPAIDLPAAATRLANGLSLQTISHQASSSEEHRRFLELHAYLAEAFPRVHQQLALEKVSGASLLYSWWGSAPEQKAILLLAHQDVVPVEPGTERAWSQPPFAGAVASGFIWGRGAMDDKGSLFAILEAAEALLSEGFAPERTVYLAFGHDEEIGGLLGAKKIAQLLAARQARIGFALDEGLAVTEGIFPGVSRPVALVGLSEKGYASFELTVEAEGGHASMPPAQTTAGRLSRAVHRLEAEPLPTRLVGPVRAMLEALGPNLAFGQRLVMRNLWLFEWAVRRQLSTAASTNALVRTTVAPTMLEGSVKENVLASKARAVVNVRLLPGDSAAEVRTELARRIDDPDVAVRQLPGIASEPSPVARADGDGFRAIARSIGEVFPDAVVAPGLVLSATDARHYAGVAEDIYRFFPFRVTREDLKRLHGTNERVSVENYREAIHFYRRLLLNAAGGELRTKP